MWNSGLRNRQTPLTETGRALGALVYAPPFGALLYWLWAPQPMRMPAAPC